MLTFMSRSVLVLLMSTTTTIAILKGASADPDLFCVNNDEYRLGGIDERTCDWIGEKENRRSKVCRNNGEAWKNCPETCHRDCNLAECPLEKPVDGSGCLEYMDSLLCEYGFHRIGCPETGFECVATHFFTCSEGHWMGEIGDFKATCEDGSNQLGGICNPCPDEIPEDGDACSMHMVCDYDFRFIGCSYDQKTCEPMQRLTCTGETWVEEDLNFFHDPNYCWDGSKPTVGEICERTSC